MNPVFDLGIFAEAEREAVEEYRRLTPRSSAHWEELSAFTPPGFLSTRGLIPYPDFIERSQGAYLHDLDGRALLDFFCAHNGAILGHNNAAVREAVQAEVERGMTFGLLRSAGELEVAELLVRRIPSLETVRFCPSGSEATMRALRVARAFTGRQRVAKTRGGYHGSADIVWYGTDSAHMHAPGTLALAPGISSHVADDVLLLPYNRPQEASDLLDQHGDELAGIIVEPMLNTGTPATVEYLKALREAATRHGIVLIFDEMICLGAARGGVQELLGVTPDMTTAGKTVAHGMPLAFYGGRADIMAVTGRGAERSMPQVVHGGTYQRHNLSLAAAAAALKQQDEAFFEHLRALGGQLRRELQALASARGWPMQVTGMAHMWSCHFSERPIMDYDDMQQQDNRPRPIVELMMLNRGVYSGLGGIVSGAHGEQEISCLREVLTTVMERLGAARWAL
jgi:glutamate-1-semialdehyde 2,1-aminomutase